MSEKNSPHYGDSHHIEIGFFNGAKNICRGQEMEKLIECIPNFSEGRSQEIIDAIVNEIRSVQHITLLDIQSDKNHNRTVLTFAGNPESIKLAAFKACAKATALINMEKHKGEHPRIGATDVIPLIPKWGVTMDACVQLANELSQEIAEKLDIPVYLYGEAARVPARKRLPDVRKFEYEDLKKEIKKPEHYPDYGSPRLHPTAGATIVGARNDLYIAYNINLNTSDVKIAKKIANAIREVKGGYKHVRAMGVKLEDRNIVQVSINMMNFKETPLHRVFETVKSEAARYGVNVVGSEIVGLAPLQAFLDVAEFYLRLEDFERRQVFEDNFFKLSLGNGDKIH